MLGASVLPLLLANVFYKPLISLIEEITYLTIGIGLYHRPDMILSGARRVVSEGFYVFH